MSDWEKRLDIEKSQLEANDSWQHRIQRPQLTIDEILMQIEFVLVRAEQGQTQKAINALRYLYLELKDRQ